jgi:exodeoxyribonuclease-3
MSRLAPADVTRGLPNFGDPQRRVLAATFGDLRVINLYVPNGQRVGSDKYQYKLDWLAALHDQLESEVARHPHCIVLGDFNIAPDDRDVHDPALWAGKVLCSEPERQALHAILGLGFRDTFRLFDQKDRAFSWWDYRAGGFRRNWGMRIDLILATSAFSARCVSCWIDTGPRRLEKPSDHTPVVAEFRDS